jgi:hypothetical protein
MRQSKIDWVSEVALPWSEGMLSARLWHSGQRTVAAVPELGLHCYGNSQTEAVFRLFTTLLKYYRQLKIAKSRLNERGLAHLELLAVWVASIEDKLKAPTFQDNVLVISNARK